jgi:OmpA-OmpF porin, OOP family
MRFKKSVVATLAIAVSAIAMPAHADDRTGGYVAVEGGIAKSPTQKLTILPNPTVAKPDPTSNSIRVKTKTGYDIAFIGGYDFGPIRGELELTQKSNSVGRVDSTALLPTKFFTGTTPPTTAKGAFPNATGSIRTQAALVNLMADIPVGETVELFAGGGIGLSKVSARKLSVSKDANFLNDSDRGFAWQLLTGFRVPVGESIELGMKYKYLHTGGLEMDDTMKRLLGSSRSTHSAVANLTIRF